MILLEIMNSLITLFVVPVIMLLLIMIRLPRTGLAFGAAATAMKAGSVMVMDVLVYEVQAHPTLATAEATEVVADYTLGWLPLWLFLTAGSVLVMIMFDRREKSRRKAALRDLD